MSFSEFIMHPKYPQICSAQPKQPKFPLPTTQKKNSETDTKQKKQHKQLISKQNNAYNLILYLKVQISWHNRNNANNSF